MEKQEDSFNFADVTKYLLSKTFLTEIDKICWTPILIEYMEKSKHHYRDLGSEDGEKAIFLYFASVGRRVLDLWFKEQKEERIGPLTNLYNIEMRNYHLNRILGENS